MLELEELLMKTGDIGKVAELALKKRPHTVLQDFSGDDGGLDVCEFYRALVRIAKASGKGAQNTKVGELKHLFSVCTPLEARYIARLVMGEMRIHVGEGAIRDAIALAFDVDKDAVEQAYMFSSDFGDVAVAARHGEIANINIRLFRPIRMMLAQIGTGLKEMLAEMGEAAVEWKYDGARVQIHIGEKEGKQIVKIYSRRSEDITAPLDDVAKGLLKAVGAKEAVLDGEAVAYDKNGKPLAFQYILRRLRRKYDIKRKQREYPIHLFLFDCMLLNGETLINKPLSERREKLESVVTEEENIHIATQVLTGDYRVAERVYNEALAAGHEGIMLKNPTSPYKPGRRGKQWLKHKPLMESLDLVVVGADWGQGKRAHYLSSFYLACVDDTTGELLEVGKVATGATEEELAELTTLLKEYIIEQTGTYVSVEPKVIMEVAYEEIQKSTNYKSGFALRFPRFVRVRPDKGIMEADTLSRVEALYRKYAHK